MRECRTRANVGKHVNTGGGGGLEFEGGNERNGMATMRLAWREKPKRRGKKRIEIKLKVQRGTFVTVIVNPKKIIWNTSIRRVPKLIINVSE